LLAGSKASARNPAAAFTDKALIEGQDSAGPIAIKVGA
jgi:hypothetical protein